jgi:hypothetical protein
LPGCESIATIDGAQDARDFAHGVKDIPRANVRQMRGPDLKAVRASILLRGAAPPGENGARDCPIRHVRDASQRSERPPWTCAR